jgi:hypothetical protein
MDEKVKAIQVRLREALSQPLSLDARYADVPIVAFEEVAVKLESPKTVVDEVRQELERRGRKVARIRHTFVSGGQGGPSLAERIDSLEEGYDVILGEGFGYITVPKLLVTDRVQEGFNLGLPNVIGYISSQEFNAVIPRFEPEDICGVADLIEADIIQRRGLEKGADVE